MRNSPIIGVVMAYVAIVGGERAIGNAELLASHERIKGESPPLETGQIRHQLRFLLDRVMGEGGLYAPDLAALAIKQAEGDPIEASFFLRAHRATLTRLGETLPSDVAEQFVDRRISSAFKDIPGGQVLGATGDYRQRLLDFNLLNENQESMKKDADAILRSLALDGSPAQDGEIPVSVIDMLRDRGMLPSRGMPPNQDILPNQEMQGVDDAKAPADITLDGIELPLPRDARLQAMARGETGGLLALAYSSMRGYGSVHPTIGELKVFKQTARIPHPFRPGETIALGRVPITEALLICGDAKEKSSSLGFELGYGACFGANENKAISMATLDRAMQAEDPRAPAQDPEFVLLHTDGIESSGFCAHFKLPHYVTFQASMDGVKAALNKAKAGKTEAAR